MRLPVIVLAVATAALMPASASATDGPCAPRDARTMLREAGQGLNGGVIEIREDRLVIEAESSYDPGTIDFGDRVTVFGPNLPAVRRGRIGIAVRRDGTRWRATRCDVIPAARMANALSGREPCPAPAVRITKLAVEGRRGRLDLRFGGDVTSVRIAWGTAVVRRSVAPGVVSLTVRHRFGAAGRRLVAVRVEGGFGPGCGTARRRSATARRTVVVG